MGNLFSHIFEKLIGKTEKRIVMIGLDAAGKTTILYNLKLGEIVTTVPTIGFNVEKVSYKNIDFNVWDIGGQDKIRKLWNYYYTNCDAIIFVIDSNDGERLDGRSSDCMDVSNAKEELYKTLEADELRNAVLLVFANKQDLPNALSVNEISQRLELPKLRHHEWRIQPCCGTRGDGLLEGLDWLVSVLSKKKSY